jgi:2-polyprenyl-3-methyl-5-hydroxy-6-metoxy-1,4-benzoquinol methylase
MTENLNDLNEETRDAWNANAQVWDEKMKDEGNDFFNVLCWPVLASFLDASTGLSASLQPDAHILDIACGNGLTTRKLVEMGAAHVTAFDFSANLINFAKKRTAEYASRITFSVIDATDEEQLHSLGEAKFDAAISNMALFDMSNIEPLFHILPKLLKPNGAFIFSITHPCFNNASSMHVVEEMDDNGEIKTMYSVKVSRYMNSYSMRGLALRNQPKPQVYFERPLQYYLNLGFQNGFVLDGFEERAFPPDIPQTTPLGWGGKFSEIPAAIVARMRLRG